MTGAAGGPQRLSTQVALTPGERPQGLTTLTAGVARWFFPLVPGSRIAVLRTAIYLFVVFDVLILVNDVIPKAQAPVDLYQPVALARLISLPPPEHGWVVALRAAVIVGALVAATGRLPRLAGWPVAVGHLVWVLYGMSYGKVDHDHFALVVALFVLPTVGRRRVRDHRGDEGAGWVLRCIQLAVVATYVLSVWAKVRFGGWDWPTGSTLLWAVERRGTFLGEHLVHVPELLLVAQWLVVVAELAAPVVFLLRGRALGVAVGGYLGFHLVTYAVISIHFLPLVICWLAFAPLERLADRLSRARARGSGPRFVDGVLGGLDPAGGAAAG